ncbi:MAG: copper amine oxidase N-terminal domain-containing protein [Vulcanibacillus sp.]
MKIKVFQRVSLIVSLTLLLGLVPSVVLADSQISQPLVSVQSNYINKVASYSVVFYTGDTVDSVLDENNSDTISLQFPAGTALPASISNANVVINNQVLNQGIITVNTVTNTIILPLPNNMVIPRKSFVRIEISQGAGIKNPSISSGNYTLQVWTNKDIIPQSSSQYSILDSMITVPSVTVSPNIIGEAGAYMIDFKLSSEGNLVANSDSIFIFFPIDTTVPASIDKSKILVNNIGLAINPTITNDPLVTGDTDSRYRMEIKVPTNIQANADVSLVIDSTANILHPTVQGNYFLEIWTSQDTVKNQSVGYEVAEAVSEITVWLSPDIAGEAGQYSVAIKNGLSQFDVGDTLTFQFPSGTVLNNTSISTNIYIDGVKLSEIASATAVVDQANLTITINPQKLVAPNGVINVLFTQNSGILNPTRQGSYALKVKTTKEIAYRSSSTYTILGNHITNLTTQLTNDGIGLNGEYLIQFTVSNYGGLVGGQDTVTIKFPVGTVLPSSLTYTDITVNDLNLTQNVVISQANRTLKIIIPNTLTIPRDGNVAIKIPQSSVIKNPSVVGEYTLDVYTSRDPVAIESSIPYIVGKQISTPTVSISPTAYNTSAQYAIGFYLSDQGALSSTLNDYIEVVFPTGTVLPASISSSQVKVNGKTVSSVVLSPLKLKITLPTGTSIANNGYVGIVINSEACILNPVGGTYQLKVSTSKDKSLVSSQSYTTVGTATSTTTTTTTTGATDNVLSMQLSSKMISDIPEYQITYKTSTTGALTAGIDEITILFDTNVVVPGYISKETIKVNGVQVNSGWVIKNGQSIIFRVPSTLTIGNNQTITITIDKLAEIANPNLVGTYSMSVKTTKDTSYASTTYSTLGSGGNQFTVTPQYNSDGLISKYTMLYITGAEGALMGGYDFVTIVLPETYTSEIIDNIKITVDGYLVEKSHIQVATKNITFLLPQNVNIASNGNLSILIEDEKQMIIPNKTYSVIFYLSTSKEAYPTPSNSINITEKDLTDPTTPTDIDIKLQIGSKVVEVNGQSSTLLTAPIIENATTLVPVRFITENLGGSVEYQEAEKRIIIIYEDEYLILTINSKVVYTIDQTLQLSVAPKVINGTTLVPLRFIAEWMDIETIWNGDDKSIILKK